MLLTRRQLVRRSFAAPDFDDSRLLLHVFKFIAYEICLCSFAPSCVWHACRSIGALFSRSAWVDFGFEEVGQRLLCTVVRCVLLDRQLKRQLVSNTCFEAVASHLKASFTL